MFSSEASARCIAHYDLDSFFVSVERLKNKKYVNRPLIVGGSEQRGVVAACSYETRAFGVHSAMPMKLALKLCPEAEVVKGDFSSYSYYSRMVTEIIKAEVPVLEKASIDEFYIDLTGMDRFFGCAKFCTSLAGKIIKETGLPVSYALASNKLISKVATNEVKPLGQIVINPGEEREYLAPLAIEKLPGIGEKTASILRKIGVSTIKELSELSISSIENNLGKSGIELLRKANGVDHSPVVPYSERLSISKEDTFNTDTADRDFLNSRLIDMVEAVAFQLRLQGKFAGCVSVKLRYSNFETHTKQSVVYYTASDKILIQTAKDLLTKVHNPTRPVRLLGVKLSNLVPGNFQLNIFSETDGNINLYKALDSIRQRFGQEAVYRAESVRRNRNVG